VKRVLVVDDEPDVADLLKTILKRDGFEVEVATGGREALRKMLAAPPDLFVLDLMMSELDGFELLKLVRLDPNLASIPVMVVSARSSHQDQIASLQLGANAYVCKPFSPRELIHQVRLLLDAEHEP